jgi:hypothetical protein
MKIGLAPVLVVARGFRGYTTSFTKIGANSLSQCRDFISANWSAHLGNKKVDARFYSAKIQFRVGQFLWGEIGAALWNSDSPSTWPGTPPIAQHDCPTWVAASGLVNFNVHL